MKDVCETLFFPVASGRIAAPDADAAVLFLQAQLCDGLDLIPDATLQQHFKPYTAQLQAEGYAVLSTVSEPLEGFDTAFALLPKNTDEAKFMIAMAVTLLKPGGRIFAAAANDAGGSRIEKWLVDCGLADVGDISKNKARCGFAVKGPDVKAEIIATWQTQGALQPVLEGAFMAQPGLFGWSKIDKGSALLVSQLPENISGPIADFGCGYGFLSDFLLQHYKGIDNLTCVDADFRALGACRKNLSKYDVPVRYLWEDLTQAQPGISDMDSIVMNPPFHDGKESDFEIGKKCIATAHESLRKGGRLWMVANVTLPYEATLKALFSDVKECAKKDGFKVFEAMK